MDQLLTSVMLLTATLSACFRSRFSSITAPGTLPFVTGLGRIRKVTAFLLLVLLLSFGPAVGFSQGNRPKLQYEVAFPDPEGHTYQVTLMCSKWAGDSIALKMPGWIPGYYQLMNYAGSVQALRAEAANGKDLGVRKTDANTWVISGIRNRSFTVTYSIRADQQFVANSYVDSSRAYVVPGNTFLYVDKQLDLPVSVRLFPAKEWKDIATGLDPVPGRPYEFTAPDFDILYDCPILVGKLDELPAFEVGGIPHRFIGYRIGQFDQARFMANLKKIVETASGLIGDIPYKHYTFIGIGPGRGGIEHLNNTTVSFDGNGLDKPGAMNRMMNFLAHEYFHHYNAKRIRPVELGPFDYDYGSRTNLLWVSEGVSVYYEYLVVKRAGLSDAATLLANLSANITAVENNPGRFHQSLQQASYNTWSDGPFGTQGKEPGRSISYYDKGPVIGLLLDFAIRNATRNGASLDDVMRHVYRTYYKEKNRGFTEAEFQSACEKVAGVPLTELFEYVYTTKEPDYQKYLAYGGLKLEEGGTIPGRNPGARNLVLTRIGTPDPLQAAILRSWLGE